MGSENSSRYETARDDAVFFWNVFMASSGSPRPYAAETRATAVVVTAAGPQFEMDRLEWRDFIIDGRHEPMVSLFASSHFRRTGFGPREAGAIVSLHACMYAFHAHTRLDTLIFHVSDEGNT